jgi:HAMP domain-containing protein
MKFFSVFSLVYKYRVFWFLVLVVVVVLGFELRASRWQGRQCTT